MMDLHNDIINLPCDENKACATIDPLAYKIGHRDARHAAAELAIGYELPAPVPESQAGDDTPENRARFEAWARKAEPGYHLAYNVSSRRAQRYDTDRTQHAYQGFLGALAALAPSAAPVAAEPEGWQPIETAPKDGTEVVLWLGAPYSEVANAWWFEPWANWQMGELPNALDDEMHGIGSAVPTHWQPLPAAPLTAPKG